MNWMSSDNGFSGGRIVAAVSAAISRINIEPHVLSAASISLVAAAATRRRDTIVPSRFSDVRAPFFRRYGGAEVRATLIGAPAQVSEPLSR